MTKLMVAFRNFAKIHKNKLSSKCSVGDVNGNLEAINTKNTCVCMYVCMYIYIYIYIYIYVCRCRRHVAHRPKIKQNFKF